MYKYYKMFVRIKSFVKYMKIKKPRLYSNIMFDNFRYRMVIQLFLCHYNLNEIIWTYIKLPLIWVIVFGLQTIILF